jgi:hypothetical protein
MPSVTTFRATSENAAGDPQRHYGSGEDFSAELDLHVESARPKHSVPTDRIELRARVTLHSPAPEWSCVQETRYRKDHSFRGLPPRE